MDNLNTTAKTIILFFVMVLSLVGVGFGAVGCSNHPTEETGGLGYAIMIIVCGMVLLGCIDPIRKMMGYND